MDTHLLREDDFVYHIVKDSEHPPETLVIMGFVGKSSKEGHIRVYLDPMLAASIEIEVASILYFEQIPRPHSPFGGYYLWLRRDASILNQVREGYQKTAQILQELSTVGSNSSNGSSTFNTMPMGWPGIVTPG